MKQTISNLRSLKGFKMGWVKTDYWFGDKCARLTIGRRELMHRARASSILGNSTGEGNRILAALEEAINSQNPNAIERIAIDAIEHFRPELKGGVLVALDTGRSHGMQWEMLYCHNSLPINKQGEFLPEIPLIPDPREVEPTYVASEFPSGGWSKG